MGVASSMFTQLVLKVCWKLRLYLEDRDYVRGTQSDMSPSDTGFLNTPKATSTPVSPSPSDPPLTDSVQTTASRDVKKARRRKHRRQGGDRVSEILSPIEEERLRIAALGKSGSRIGITPSVPKRAPLVTRNVVCTNDYIEFSEKSHSFMALDLAVKPIRLQKRVGLRL